MTFRRTQCVRNPDSAEVPPLHVPSEDELRELFTPDRDGSTGPSHLIRH
jgi:hypothetical protein